MDMKRIGAVAFCAIVTGLPAGTAWAAEQQLEEIIVTAERRSQNLQEVPLSITAFKDETRDRVGILSIQDMTDFAPGMNFNMTTDRPSIRGIWRQSNTFSLDSPVANYYDGVYTSSVQDAQRRPIFIERTEILRGPQGALSGRGSIAGAVNTISKRPSDTFGYEIRSAVSSYRGYLAEGTVTGPLTSWMNVRVNLGVYRQDEGFFKNVATGRTEGDQPNNRQIADYLFTFNLGEKWDLFVKAAFADYDESRHTGGSLAPEVADVLGGTPTPYGTLGSPLVPLAEWGYFDPTGTYLGKYDGNATRITRDLREFNNNFLAHQKLDGHHDYSADLTWHGETFDVRWIGGHQNYSYQQQTDLDGTAVTSMTIPNLYGLTPRVVDPSGINTYQEQRTWYSNEITITSTKDSPFQWIVGVYRSNEDYHQEPATYTYKGYPELAAPTGAPANLKGNASVFGQLIGDTVSTALFGQIDYELSDQWKFTFGLRKNKDEKHVDEFTRYVGNNFKFGWYYAGIGQAIDVSPTPAADPSLYPKGVYANYKDTTTGMTVRKMKGSWDGVTGTAGVDYQLNSDTLLYLRIASGYRPGGFDAGFMLPDPGVDKETVISYEVGYKGTIAEQLLVSASYFYYNFEDQQLSLPSLGRCTDPADLNTCTVLNGFFNIPKTVNQGFELEATWIATERLSFLLSLGTLDTEIKDGLVNGNGFQNPLDPAALLPNAHRYQEITGASGTQIDAGYTNLPRWTQDLTGNELLYAPRAKVAFNVSYVMPLGPGDLTLSANYVWRDQQYGDVFESKPAIIPGFHTLGARAIWNSSDDHYTVILYCSNLADAYQRDAGGTTRLATPLSGAEGQAYFQWYGLTPPRTYGLEVQYRM